MNQEYFFPGCIEKMADGVDIDIYADDLDKDFNQTQVNYDLLVAKTVNFNSPHTFYCTL